MFILSSANAFNLDCLKFCHFGKELFHFSELSLFWFQKISNPFNVCLGFYAVSTVFQLFNGNISQIQVSWTSFNQNLTSPLSWHWQVSAIPIILKAKGESQYYQF